MYKVFNAIYKTDNTYAEGFIVFSNDYNEIEGVFALDYAFIYNDYQKTLLTLKSCFWEKGLKYSFSEFTSHFTDIQPNKTFFFYNNSKKMLTL